MANGSEITKVRLIIRHFLWQTRDVVTDAKASQEWLARFRRTLEFQELEENPDAYALALLAEARSFNDLQRRKQQMRWVRSALAKEGVEDPTQEQLDERWLALYGYEFTQDAPHGDAGEDLPTAGNRGALELPTSCDTLTADGDTREGSQDMHRARKGGTPESATSANLYTLDRLPGKANDPTPSAVATTREGVDGHARAGNRATLESGTAAEGKGRGVVGKVSAATPPDAEDMYAFTFKEGLDEFDAREWFEMSASRGWTDRNGNPIANWKGAMRRYCEAKARRRKEKENGK